MWIFVDLASVLYVVGGTSVSAAGQLSIVELKTMWSQNVWYANRFYSLIQKSGFSVVSFQALKKHLEMIRKSVKNTYNATNQRIVKKNATLYKLSREFEMKYLADTLVPKTVTEADVRW